METRKLSHFTDVNRLGMHDFTISSFDGYDETLLIIGERGYPHHYRVEIHFSGVAYLACAPSFDWSFRFRLATDEEASRIRACLDLENIAVYCLEEDISGWTPPLKRKAHTFFIAAWKIDITVHYDGGNLDELLGPTAAHEGLS